MIDTLSLTVTTPIVSSINTHAALHCFTTSSCRFILVRSLIRLSSLRNIQTLFLTIRRQLVVTYITRIVSCYNIELSH